MKVLKSVLLVLLFVMGGLALASCEIIGGQPDIDGPIVEVPEEPEVPENPETPVEPEVPENPETPVEPEEPETPVEPENPETPEEPEVPVEPEEPVIEDKQLVFDKGIDKDVWETIILDVTGYAQIKITISEESTYDVPVNIDNFKVNGEGVSHSDISGTKYLKEHQFKIGVLDAIGENVNIHQGNIRLHTHQSNARVDHYILIDVSGIDTFEFQYKVTTNAYAYLGAVVVDLEIKLS